MTGQKFEKLRMNVIRKPQWFGAVFALLWALAVPGSAECAPVINGAYLNLAAGTITIEGMDFGTGVPIVNLAGAPLVVQQSSPTLIVASLPTGLAEGSYLLTVQPSSGKQMARFEVTADREFNLAYATATGGGPNPSSTTQFFGVPVSVTVTHPNQRVLVTAFNAFGTFSSAAGSLNIFICYQQPPGPVTLIGNGLLGLQLPPNTKVTNGLTKVITLPVGTYWVGMCGTGGANWTNNDWGTTTAIVFYGAA
jgi:hypothetical protein